MRLRVWARSVCTNRSPVSYSADALPFVKYVFVTGNSANVS